MKRGLRAERLRFASVLARKDTEREMMKLMASKGCLFSCGWLPPEMPMLAPDSCTTGLAASNGL
jgi:hypothetical protein